MFEPLFKLEDALLRVEKWLLVVGVLMMLLLAVYTVFYRNLLVPWQNHLRTSGPPVVQPAPTPHASQPEPAEKAKPSANEGFGGGFGGGFGDSAAGKDDKADKPSDDAAGGFGGGFGDAQPDKADKPSGDAAAGGFGGGFGDSDGEKGDKASDQAGGGFGGGFGGGADQEKSAEAPTKASASPNKPEPPASRPAEPLGGPPPQGSVAARLIDVIDAVKFSWIDVFLRQLVIICGFLGAMLATRKRTHITVDAVGKLLKGRTEHVVHTVTNLVATAVCIMLAISGKDLVAVGLQYPERLFSWAMTWQFQLAFPIGWGLLAFHFFMRVIESAGLAIHGEPDEGDGGAQPREGAA